MMIAASFSLFWEGWFFEEPDDNSDFSSAFRTVAGALLGFTFILGTKQFLDKYEDLKVGGLAGTDARRALLIFFVMTLHSFSEGVGIGVSFGGAHGSELGLFISASLAVHNIPEGLAIAVVLIPKKTAKLTAALWAILTSIPQPLMAVPSYLFVKYFISILPIGLGFAGGAMAWVAFMELLMEAYEEIGIVSTGFVSALSLSAMLLLQRAIDEGSRS
jgi:zinc transporter, ZIP family